MLTEKDIEFIKESRAEVIKNRRRTITIEYETEGERNPITGVVEGSTGTVEVLSVVTDRTSRVAAERVIREGAEAVEGDIWFSIDMTELNRANVQAEDIRRATHNGDKYSVVAHDPKGIGEYNRFEFVGKKVV